MDIEGLLKLLSENAVDYVIEMKRAAGRPKDNEDLKVLLRSLLVSGRNLQHSGLTRLSEQCRMQA